MRQLKRLFQISPGELTKRLPNFDLVRTGSAREARREAVLDPAVLAALEGVTTGEVAAVRADVCGRTVGLPGCLVGVVMFYALVP